MGDRKGDVSKRTFLVRLTAESGQGGITAVGRLRQSFSPPQSARVPRSVVPINTLKSTRFSQYPITHLYDRKAAPRKTGFILRW